MNESIERREGSKSPSRVPLYNPRTIPGLAETCTQRYLLELPVPNAAPSAWASYLLSVVRLPQCGAGAAEHHRVPSTEIPGRSSNLRGAFGVLEPRNWGRGGFKRAPRKKNETEGAFYSK